MSRAENGFRPGRFRPGETPGEAPASGAIFLLALFALRWLAGIVENAGVPALSQAAALVMLVGLGLSFLFRMRLAADATLLLAGIGAWILGGLASLAANPGLALLPTLELLALLTLYALFANASLTRLNGRGALRLARDLLRAFLLIGGVLSVWQVASGNGFVEQGRATLQRAYGSDVHPVSFAIQLVAAMVALEVTRLRLGARAGVLHLACMGLGVAALYLTYARTAWLMGALTLALPLLLQGPPARRLLAGLGGGLALLGLVLGSDRFADLASLPEFWAGFAWDDVVFDWRYIDNSLSWRVVNWSYGLHQALERPVLGYGPGQSASSSYFALEMHNIFLEAFFEGGLIGLAALLLVLAGLVRLHRRLPRRTATDRRIRLLSNGFGLALLLGVTFSTSFVDQLMSFLLYLLLIGLASCTPTEARPPGASAPAATPTLPEAPARSPAPQLRNRGTGPFWHRSRPPGQGGERRLPFPTPHATFPP